MVGYTCALVGDTEIVLMAFVMTLGKVWSNSSDSYLGDDLCGDYAGRLYGEMGASFCAARRDATFGDFWHFRA